MNSFAAAAPRPLDASAVGQAVEALRRVAPVLFLAVGVVGLRLPSFSFDVLNVDESVYHLMGQAWLHGTLPHLGIVDNKPLGLYAIHALAGAIFADPIAGARLLGACATFAAAWLLMRIAETFLGLSRGAGVVCGLLFATYAILLGGDASQGPVFYAPLLAGGAFLIMGEIAALHRNEAPSIAKLAMAGLLLGLSLQIKYVTVFECAAFGLFYLHAAWRADATTSAEFRARIIAGAGVLIAGGLLPTATAIAMYVAVGEGSTFIFYTFMSNAARAMTQDAFAVVACRIGLILFALSPLMAPSVEFLRTPSTLTRPRWIAKFLAAWFVAAMAGGVAQLQFADHYFYEAVIPLAVMAAAAIFAPGAPRRARITACALLGMAVTGYVGVRSAAVDHNGGRNVPSVIAHDIVGAGAGSMYVFNSHTLLHLLTGIPLPTKYPLADHLLRDINAEMFGLDARAEMARVLDGDQDVVVVDRPINPTVSADRQKMLETKLAADYCLWRQYPTGAHHVEVYLLNEFPGAAHCAPPEKVTARRAPFGVRTFPPTRKPVAPVMIARSPYESEVVAVLQH